MKLRTRILIGCSIFVTGIALLLFFAWLGGYDFNARNPDIACGFDFGLLFTSAAAVLIPSALPNKEAA